MVIRHCIIGGLPFGKQFTNAEEDKTAILKSMKSTHLLWEPRSLNGVPKIRRLLQSCFELQSNLRPPANFVAKTLLDSFVELSCRDVSILTTTVDRLSEGALEELKLECFDLIRKARAGQADG